MSTVRTGRENGNSPVPANVPLLSSGRIQKSGGLSSKRRASPWYVTTGERQEAAGHEEARPSASTACWAAGDVERELAVARSIGLVVDLRKGLPAWLERERCSEGSKARRHELERRHPEACALGRSSRSSGGEAVSAARRKERSVLQRTLPKPGARPSPWYFTTGERNEFNRRPGSLAITLAGGNGAVSLSSPVAEDEAGRTVCKTPNALLVLGQSERTARHPRRQ